MADRAEKRFPCHSRNFKLHSSFPFRHTPRDGLSSVDSLTTHTVGPLLVTSPRAVRYVGCLPRRPAGPTRMQKVAVSSSPHESSSSGSPVVAPGLASRGPFSGRTMCRAWLRCSLASYLASHLSRSAVAPSSSGASGTCAVRGRTSTLGTSRRASVPISVRWVTGVATRGTSCGSPVTGGLEVANLYWLSMTGTVWVAGCSTGTCQSAAMAAGGIYTGSSITEGLGRDNPNRSGTSRTYGGTYPFIPCPYSPRKLGLKGGGTIEGRSVGP